MKSTLARWLRQYADRIDPDGFSAWADRATVGSGPTPQALHSAYQTWASGLAASRQVPAGDSQCAS